MNYGSLWERLVSGVRWSWVDPRYQSALLQRSQYLSDSRPSYPEFVRQLLFAHFGTGGQFVTGNLSPQFAHDLVHSERPGLRALGLS